MRNLLFTAAALALAACGTPKSATENTKAIDSQEAGNGYSIGRMTSAHASEGCAWLMKLEDAGGLFLLPIALEDRYKKEGLRLKFRYRPSKASSGDCLKGSPAILEEITVVPE
jgi:hypothetical protein